MNCIDKKNMFALLKAHALKVSALVDYLNVREPL